MSNQNILVSGAGMDLPAVIGDLYSAYTFNSSNLGPSTLVTGAPGYILTRLFVEVDPICTQASAGMATLNWTDSGSGLVVGQARIWIPATVTNPTVAQLASVASSGTGYWFRSRNALSTCVVTLNSTLTAGSVRVAVNYALISQDS